ncbi:hypothetical protein CROQUDRAFT_87310 [Cronartium quercuum f. sp. fusiforme G11]|uniref:Uncharacterized protein n=1 Tax=Cronartium quercuum f. sp. fusiforme G11 TaxID=708437 RepID=A0A9P6NUZ0_9BASI|nr:hypothetical protein CROQUDRAFT_87310 [Cronartium quercuum f. sp. fusiforme G11]
MSLNPWRTDFSTIPHTSFPQPEDTSMRDCQIPPHFDDTSDRQISVPAPPSSDGILSLTGRQPLSTTFSSNSEVLLALNTLKNTVQQLAADMSKMKLNSNQNQEMRFPSHFAKYRPPPVLNPINQNPLNTGTYCQRVGYITCQLSSYYNITGTSDLHHGGVFG